MNPYLFVSYIPPPLTEYLDDIYVRTADIFSGPLPLRIETNQEILKFVSINVKTSSRGQVYNAAMKNVYPSNCQALAF